MVQNRLFSYDRGLGRRKGRELFLLFLPVVVSHVASPNHISPSRRLVGRFFFRFWILREIPRGGYLGVATPTGPFRRLSGTFLRGGRGGVGALAWSVELRGAGVESIGVRVKIKRRKFCTKIGGRYGRRPANSWTKELDHVCYLCNLQGQFSHHLRCKVSDWPPGLVPCERVPGFGFPIRVLGTPSRSAACLSRPSIPRPADTARSQTAE